TAERAPAAAPYRHRARLARADVAHDPGPAERRTAGLLPRGRERSDAREPEASAPAQRRERPALRQRRRAGPPRHRSASPFLRGPKPAVALSCNKRVVGEDN